MGNISDMKVYENQLFGGMYEIMQQNIDAFNASSAGAILLQTSLQKGQFNKESFFKVTDLISDRDPASDADADKKSLIQGEFVSPKCNKRIGPLEQTLDSFKKIGVSGDEIPLYVGRQSAPAVQQSYLNSAMAATVGTVGSTAGLVHDITASTGTKTVNHADMAIAMGKLGDAFQSLTIWVMHSKAYFDLVGNAIGEKIFEVSSGTIYGGTPGTFGRPVLVTDAPALVDATDPAAPVYYTFCLTPSALVVTESEERSALAQVIGGSDNLKMLVQAEYAYNVTVKGFAYSGAASPSDAVLTASANWDLAASSLKSTAGVCLRSL